MRTRDTELIRVSKDFAAFLRNFTRENNLPSIADASTIIPNLLKKSKIIVVLKRNTDKRETLFDFF